MPTTGPAGGSVQIDGLKELQSTMRKLGADMADWNALNGKVGDLVANASRVMAPKRSGRLAGSIRSGRTRTAAIVRMGGARVPYANAVHWGTGPRLGRRGPHNIVGHRFIWQAAQDTEATWQRIYLEGLQAMVDKVRGT